MYPSLLVAVALAALAVAAVVGREEAADPEPSPEWTPAEVIRMQVEALQDNDTPSPDAGIATAFRFASPANRAATGPLARFTDMVHGPGYRAMLDFERAEYGPIRVEGDVAAQEVTLIHGDGRRTTYLFGLSRQSGGECDGCWMTDAVVRREAPAGTTRV